MPTLPIILSIAGILCVTASLAISLYRGVATPKPPSPPWESIALRWQAVSEEQSKVLQDQSKAIQKQSKVMHDQSKTIQDQSGLIKTLTENDERSKDYWKKQFDQDAAIIIDLLLQAGKSEAVVSTTYPEKTGLSFEHNQATEGKVEVRIMKFLDEIIYTNHGDLEKETYLRENMNQRDETRRD